MKSRYSIEKVDLRTKVTQALEQYILENNLKPGDQLPSERELASLLSIGRNSLRETIRKLETIGMIEVVIGKGTFIKKIQEGGLSLNIKTAKVNFFELLEIRRTLEDFAIEKVVKNATEGDLKTIAKKLALYEQACANGQDAEREDKEFHHSIYKAAKNSMLYELIYPLADTFGELWLSLIKPEDKNAMFTETLSLHQDLYLALFSRDEVQAKDIMHKILDMDYQKVTRID